MKVLLVSSFFPPTHNAGTEKRTLGYALALRELQHEVQVVCVGDWDRGSRYWNGYTNELVQGIPVRRVNLNWVLAPDPNRFLVQNPIVYNHLKDWLMAWQPDIVHVTSCLTLSASVIPAAKAVGIPVILTLTDFWFICPRSILVRGDGNLCDGRTSDWQCLQCKLWNTKVYRGLYSITPEKITAKTLTWISKKNSINRIRGLRGHSVDMEHRRRFLTQMLNVADCIIAPSSHLQDIFNAAGVNKPIRLIHSGHDLSWRERTTIGQVNINGLVRIGYIGQIIPIKGVHTLLVAFAAANLSGKAQLQIFGEYDKDQEYWKRLKSLIVKQNGSIKMQGPFPHERLGEVLSSIDVLVVPSSWHENNPRVIQEAFALKIPVIASNVGGNNEFVQPEVNGLLFERENEDELTRQLRRIVLEPDLLRQLQEGIPPVKTIQEEVYELDQIYRELQEGRKVVDFPVT